MKNVNFRKPSLSLISTYNLLFIFEPHIFEKMVRGQIRFFVLLQIRFNSVGFAVFRSSEPMTEIILSGRQDVLRWKMSQYISRSSIVNSAPYRKMFIWFYWFSSNSIIIYFLSIYLSIHLSICLSIWLDFRNLLIFQFISICLCDPKAYRMQMQIVF